MTTSPALAETVADVMHAPVLTCGPETLVPDVARTMADAGVHAVVVTGIEGTPWSVLTARSLAAVTAAAAPRTTAREIATAAALTVAAGADLDGAARRMAEHGLDHALVLDEHGRPAGILSSLDLVRRHAA